MRRRSLGDLEDLIILLWFCINYCKKAKKADTANKQFENIHINDLLNKHEYNLFKPKKLSTRKQNSETRTQQNPVLL